MNTCFIRKSCSQRQSLGLTQIDKQFYDMEKLLPDNTREKLCTMAKCPTDMYIACPFTEFLNKRCPNFFCRFVFDPAKLRMFNFLFELKEIRLLGEKDITDLADIFGVICLKKSNNLKSQCLYTIIETMRLFSG